MLNLSKLTCSSTKLIGLDINPTYIALTELKITHPNTSTHKNHSNPSYELTAFAFTPISYHEHNYYDKDIIAKTILLLLAKTTLKTRKTAIALPYSIIHQRTITLNYQLPENKIEEFLKINSAKYLNADPNTVSFDYYLPNKTDQANELTLNIITANQESINKYTGLLAATPLQLTVIDADIYALARAASLLHPEIEPPYIIMHLDPEKILSGVIKNVNHLPSLELAQEHFITDQAKQNHQTLIQFTLEQLQVIININDKNHRITAIILCGIKVTAELAHTITHKTNIPTLIANPFNKIALAPHLQSHTTALQAIAPSLMLSCGLALHEYI